MAIGQLWETLKASILAYTGVSPTVFFTVLAVAAAFYYVLSGILSSTTQPQHHQSRDFEEIAPLPPPVQLGEITAEELKQYDGSDPKKPLLMAIKGQIYDVSQSRIFYGPGGPYALFAGKDASRALAKMSFEEKDLTGDVSDLGAFELDALQDWEYKFMSKYVKVGTVKKPETVTVESAATSSKVTEAEAVAEDAVDSHVEPKEVGSSVDLSKEPAEEVCSTNENESHTTKVGDSASGNEEHVEPELAKEAETSKD